MEDVTAGSVRMGPGTLYGSIQRMIDSRLIEEAPRARKATTDDDERRRYYRLTALGRRTLELEVSRLDAIVSIARGKKLLGAVGSA